MEEKVFDRGNCRVFEVISPLCYLHQGLLYLYYVFSGSNRDA